MMDDIAVPHKYLKKCSLNCDPYLKMRNWNLGDTHYIMNLGNLQLSLGTDLLRTSLLVEIYSGITNFVFSNITSKYWNQFFFQEKNIRFAWKLQNIISPPSNHYLVPNSWENLQESCQNFCRAFVLNDTSWMNGPRFWWKLWRTFLCPSSTSWKMYIHENISSNVEHQVAPECCEFVESLPKYGNVISFASSLKSVDGVATTFSDTPYVF